MLLCVCVCVCFLEGIFVFWRKKIHVAQKTCSLLQSLSAKTAELESLKSEWNARITDMKARHKEDLAVEKEKFLQVCCLKGFSLCGVVDGLTYVLEGWWGN